jgi:eukaryotic-like serine/threonine-protein kinase
MPDRRLIGRPTRQSPADLGTTPGAPLSLPNDLLQQASRRLEIMALIAAALWILGPVFGHLALFVTHPEDPRWAQFRTIDIVAASCVVLSLSLFAYLRSGERDPASVMDLALVYLVANAFSLGIMVHWGSPDAAAADPAPMISWIGPVVLIFAAIVPTSSWKLLVAGFVAVSMDPLGMMLAGAAGDYPHGSLSSALIMHYPSYMLLGVAVVISRVVNRLGQQVRREREMGSYRLGELLGRGGMGEVYRATHRMLARPAAIKLIRPEALAAADGGMAQLAVTRFRREAEAAAKLRSPHTVELYDFGVTEDRTLYLVMELLEGMDLESLVRQVGPLPAARVVHIVRQVCESLEEAHADGLIHRDIKPANIHVGRVGLRYDFVKVLDFGLVKHLANGAGDVAVEHSQATATGLTPGTPAYMAPEMSLGEAVDGRADLYALGCVAYYLLTGKVVFEAETSLQMVAKHLQATPIPPSRRADVEVPPALERVVLACLAKAPADRPGSALELDRLLGEVPVSPWGEEEAKRWWTARDAAHPTPRDAA